MTDTTHIADDAHSTYESVTDPEAIAESEGLEIRQRTYIHGNREHCEADAVGRAIVGVTDEDGRLLLLINPETDNAILPNDPVLADEDWATVGRRRIEEQAGIGVTLDAVTRVRRVNHVLDGESTPRSTTHHVVFGASVASSDATIDALGDDDWEIGWYDAFPVEVEDTETGSIDDIRLFLG